MFEKFKTTFSPEQSKISVDTVSLAQFAKETLQINIPVAVLAFWNEMGSGYFGERMLYVFGDEVLKRPRDSFQDWNTKDFWAKIYPFPREAAPGFFAETCFGNQIGFRWEGDQVIYLLFCIDTFEAFVIARSDSELFEEVLGDQYAFEEEGRLRAVRKALGDLRDGMHYAPVVSPLIGGENKVENICLETANVHFRLAMATYEAIGNATAV